MISALTSTSNSAATPSTVASTGSASSSVQNDAMGKDAFLKLLVAQLKYQNPLSPMDGTQFIAQTAQLTMVERLEEISKLTNQATAAANSQAAASLVGRTIAFDNGTSLVEGVVTAAKLNGGAPVLTVGKTDVALGLVREVRTTPTTATPTAATPTAATPTTATPTTATPTTHGDMDVTGPKAASAAEPSPVAETTGTSSAR